MLVKVLPDYLSSSSATVAGCLQSASTDLIFRGQWCSRPLLLSCIRILVKTMSRLVLNLRATKDSHSTNWAISQTLGHNELMKNVIVNVTESPGNQTFVLSWNFSALMLYSMRALSSMKWSFVKLITPRRTEWESPLLHRFGVPFYPTEMTTGYDDYWATRRTRRRWRHFYTHTPTSSCENPDKITHEPVIFSSHPPT